MKQIELESPIEEMSEADLRATFAAVMEAHDENLTEFTAVKESLDAAESDVEAAKAYFAERASEATTLDADVLATRFSLEELRDMSGDLAGESELDVEAPESEGEFHDEEGDEEGSFAEKPERGVSVPEASAKEKFSEEARGRLSRIPGIVLD